MSTLMDDRFKEWFPTFERLVNEGARSEYLEAQFKALLAQSPSQEKDALVYLLWAKALTASRHLPTARHVLTAALRCCPEDLGLRGRIEYRLAQVLFELGYYQEAYEHAVKAVDHLEHSRGRDPQVVALRDWAQELVRELEWRKKHPYAGKLRCWLHELNHNKAVLVSPAHW